MTLQYQTLCSIAFKHPYYRDGNSRDFSLAPTPSSVEQMQSFGLIAKTINGKTTILQKMAGSTAETPITKPIRLNFTIDLNNPLLLNVTETLNTRRFYLTNLDATGALKSRLTEQAMLSQLDALPILSPQRVSMNFPKAQFQQLAIQRTIPTIGSQNLPPLSINSNMENVEVNLRDSGKYTLTKLPANTSETLYAHNEISPKSTFFGVLDLFLTSTIVPNTVYQVVLQQRTFKWQYFFIDVKNKPLNFTNPTDISLRFTKNTGDPITPDVVGFVYLNEFVMSDDSLKVVRDIKNNNRDMVNNVYLFESDFPIAILESRPHIVEMTLSTPPTVKPQLPIPDIENIQIRLPTANANTANAMIFYNI
jgi:hypothetical protein